jgi:hypothetical protein
MSWSAMMAEHNLLAEKLIGYATSAQLRDQPQMRRDLVAASEWLTAYAALLDAWKAFFGGCDVDADIDRLKPHLRQQFAELFGATPDANAWKQQLRLKRVVSDDTENASPEDRP